MKSLIYSHLITLLSHSHHNFLHSCLRALPEFSSQSDLVLMGLLNSILNSLRCINKQDLFHFLTQCMQESIQGTYVSKAEVYLVSIAETLYNHYLYYHLMEGTVLEFLHENLFRILHVDDINGMHLIRTGPADYSVCFLGELWC